MKTDAVSGMLPSPDAAPAANGRAPLTPAQKAALVIAALGPDAAGPIIEKVGDRHLRAFAEACAHLAKVPREELIAVVGEFIGKLGGESQGTMGGLDQARELIARVKGPDGAARILDDIDAPGGRTVWQKLDDEADDAIAAFLEKQHPQTVAVILSRMSPDKASSVLDQLNPEAAEDAIIRLSKPIAVRREALNVLAQTIEKEFLAPMRRAAKTQKPGLMLGGLMNNLSPDRRDNFLRFIEEKTPDILDDVRSCILTFQDVPARVPPNAIATIVREMEGPAFLKAMKYGRQNAAETVEFVFKNISQRMKQQYEEEMEGLKQVTVPEAEAAQALFMSTVRRLVAEGAFKLIEIARPEEEEQQVAYI